MNKVTEDGIEYEVKKYKNGDKSWFLNELFHRENGPAIDNHNGYKAWIKYNLFHRTDGPARIFSDGYKEYWLNGEYYPDIESDEEWLLFQIIT